MKNSNKDFKNIGKYGDECMDIKSFMIKIKYEIIKDLTFTVYISALIICAVVATLLGYTILGMASLLIVAAASYIQNRGGSTNEVSR